MVNLRSWPADMRLIVRAERPHPAAQLRFTDSNGTPASPRSRPTPAVGSWQRSNFGTAAAPAARTASGQRNPLAREKKLPLHGFQQNQISVAIVMLACELTAWLQRCWP
jgi:hypothetical protein